ncbi:hypothetical protein VMCG_02093 [Cytospora schulzeri]|uniref:C2H2-type domain-containing protein n=1 Tax=Cytospora schulzeri TaxID=448051 RepID=A0A423X2U9_9PEZI|nr:hypothetical protein VMCG_02093 [Valsa malicola]
MDPEYAVPSSTTPGPQLQPRPAIAEEQQPQKTYCKYPGCTKSFERKDTLHRHVLQHNSPTDDGSMKTSLASETYRLRKVKYDSDDPVLGL